MHLSEKLEHLRSLEGQLRGLGRSITKSELARAMRAELGASLSVPYLSQIEGGSRPHLTAQSRDLLARFFKVHPGYLVSDPEGFAESLGSPIGQANCDLGAWLAAGPRSSATTPKSTRCYCSIASQPDPRATLLALGRALRGGATDG